LITEEKIMTVSRRELLKLVGTGAAAMCVAGAELPQKCFAQRRRRMQAASEVPVTPAKIPIGLELWTVRTLCEKGGLPDVLKKVAAMGYQAVELAHSYYGFDAAAWRKMLDENKLKPCGMHLGLPDLEGENLPKTVEFHQVLGTPYLIIAAVPESNLASPQAILDTAKRFNAISQQLKPLGFRLGYHCHGGDFAKIQRDKTPWELIGENTEPDVIMQLDIGHCMGAGADPLAMLKKFPGRGLSIHLKEHGGKPGAAIGEGDVPWKEIFQVCETTAGTKVYVVEQQSHKEPDDLDVEDRSLKNLRKMGK
jgi:sugar phosphate isomerase/epimerase